MAHQLKDCKQRLTGCHNLQALLGCSSLTDFSKHLGAANLFAQSYATFDSTAQLAYEEIPAPGAPEKDAAVSTCLLVHGLLGSGRNWRTFSRRLVAEVYASSGRQAHSYCFAGL